MQQLGFTLCHYAWVCFTEGWFPLEWWKLAVHWDGTVLLLGRAPSTIPFTRMSPYCRPLFWSHSSGTIRFPQQAGHCPWPANQSRHAQMMQVTHPIYRVPHLDGWLRSQWISVSNRRTIFPEMADGVHKGTTPSTNSTCNIGTVPPTC